MKVFNRELDFADFEKSVALFRDLLIFFVVVSYFMGWMYLSEYMSHFGLHPSTLEIPLYDYLIFSFSPLYALAANPTWAQIGWMVALGILLVGTAVAYRVKFAVGHISVVVTFVAMLFFVFQLAIETAQSHARFMLDVGGGKRIVFVFDQEVRSAYAEIIGPNLLQANDQGDLRLVWRTKDDVYVVHPSKERNPLGITSPTYRVPVKSFVFSQVIGNRTKRD